MYFRGKLDEDLLVDSILLLRFCRVFFLFTLQTLIKQQSKEEKDEERKARKAEEREEKMKIAEDAEPGSMPDTEMAERYVN